jgi:4-oxalocrotonate tautomerase
MQDGVLDQLIYPTASAATVVRAYRVKPGDWADKVYKPDILNGAGRLYKGPGYEPLE